MKFKIAIFGLALMIAIPPFARPIEKEAASNEFSEEQIQMLQSMVYFEVVEEPIEADAEMVEPTEVVIPEREYIILEQIPWDDDLQIWAQQKCRQYNIPYSMFLAFCESECSFKWYGDIDDSGGISTGYMMIRQCNWNRYDGLDVHDPYDNLEIGIRMISELKEKYMEVDMIVMAYKGGETAAVKWKEEGFRLDVCDKLEDRMVYWEELLNGKVF